MMKPNWNLYGLSVCAVCFFFAVSQIVFVQFVHYHSQNRIMNPNDYHIEIVSQADYQKLANPENRTVALSNNTTFEKSDAWESIVLPNYKPVEKTADYALVTMKGTAPFAGAMTAMLVQMAAFSLAIFILISLGMRQARQAPRP